MPLVMDWMRGRLKTNHVLEKVSIATATSQETLYTELVKSCRQMTFISDRIIPLIQKIRNSGIKAVLATDNMDVFSTYTVPHMRLSDVFDDMLVSSDIGAIKADETTEGNLAFFARYLEKNDLVLQQAVLIDDNISKKIYFESKGLDFLPVTQTTPLVYYLEKYINAEGEDVTYGEKEAHRRCCRRHGLWQNGCHYLKQHWRCYSGILDCYHQKCRIAQLMVTALVAKYFARTSLNQYQSAPL